MDNKPEYDKDYRYYLYGIDEFNLKKISNIFNNGITSNKENDIELLMRNIPEEYFVAEPLEELMTNFLYKRYCFLIKIPKKYLYDLQNHNPPLPFWKNEDNNQKTIVFIPNLIDGLLNKETNEYIANPNYSAVFNPNGLIFDKSQEEYLKKRGYLAWYYYCLGRHDKTYKELEKLDQKKGTWEQMVKRYEQIFEPTTDKCLKKVK